MDWVSVFKVGTEFREEILICAREISAARIIKRTREPAQKTGKLSSAKSERNKLQLRDILDRSENAQWNRFRAIKMAGRRVRV